jgi:uncharacterized repeat protein (TIGR01451 family)
LTALIYDFSGNSYHYNSDAGLDVLSVTAVDAADLSVLKSDSPDPVVAGATLTYTLAVNNAGPGSATNIAVEDTLPAGVTFASASGTGWTCGEAAGVVTCTRASLAAGDAPDITVTVTAPDEATTLNNSVSVSSDGDLNSSNDSDSENTTVTASADLSVTKTDNPDPVVGGESLTYKVSVSNAGPSTASNLSVADTLPGGVTFVSASGAGWTCTQAVGVVTCTRASLAVGSAPDITITVTVPASATTLSNTVSVSSDTTDPDHTNDSASEDTGVVASADLSVSKSDSPDPVVAGGTLTYKVSVSDGGPSGAVNLTMTETLPAGVTFVSASGTDWTCNEAAGVVTCTRASLSVGPAPDITITVTAPDEATTLINNASVSSDTVDPNSGNDSASEDTTVSASADLSLTKSDAADPVVAGESLTYTISVGNAGPSTAANVSVADTLPASVTFVSASGTGWSCTEASGIVTCTRASLAVGAAPDITIEVTAGLDAGTLNNSAQVSSDTDDPDSGNDSDSEETTVTASADLGVTKTGSPNPVAPEGTLTYTISINNSGPSAASNVEVSDTLPPNATFVSASGSGWSCNEASGVVTCTRPNLDAGAATVIVIVVKAPADVPSALNSVSIQSDTPDPEGDNNSDTERTAVDEGADLAIIKTDNPDPVFAGEALTYTLLITNNGPSTAANVEVVDTLPPNVTFVGVAGAGWSCGEAAGIVTCSLASLAAGDVADIEIQVTAPPSGGAITNRATVTSATPDAVPGNDTTLEDTAVAGLELVAAPRCTNDVAWLDYTATALNFTPSGGAMITWTKLNDQVAQTLTGQPLSGSLLWPGMVVDSEGDAVDWPGWQLVNEEWVPIDDGIRPTIRFTVSVNPEMTVEVTYPAATQACNAGPVSGDDPGTDSDDDPLPIPFLGDYGMWTLSGLLSLVGYLGLRWRRRSGNATT